MVRYLEDMLEEKTRGKHSNILYAHWCYDKKVIPQALNAITSLFPHYSLHDETHAFAIINNICRVLGLENIDRLSAIDIWLLLEASYGHDIGMVITAQDIIDALNSEEFLTFFKSLQLNSAHSLHEYANAFVVNNKSLNYANNVFNIKNYDGIKFILADYFRSKHAARSREIIVNPLERLGVNSPRAVIPPRLFKVLGDICTSHTQDFKEVMRLPFVEAGIDIEDAHPCFIACMLRLGDLLDLDNNRFSEVMLKTLTQIPLDTLKHKQKHLSFNRIRIDRDIIEICAYCKEDYDTANITQQWLDYLNKEVSNQMIRWSTIVPSRDFGYLPTIGDLKVELGDYEYIDGKERPQFKVDTSKALELLQGTGLYKRKEQCIRELLQNAVDSTLIRIWLDHGKEHPELFENPQSEEFSNVAKNYSIYICISEGAIVDGLIPVTVSIEDNGTGISKVDLKYISNTGSSSKNWDRKRIIQEMPIWLKPSGIFGIGFQSVFMRTDKVVLNTKSFFTEELKHIELYAPNSKYRGEILVKPICTNHSRKPGTKLIFSFEAEAITKDWSIPGGFEATMQIMHAYDPFSSTSMNLSVGMIIDEISQFSECSPIPIVLTYNDKRIEVEKLPSFKSKEFKYYDIENSLELTVILPEYSAKPQSGSMRVCYYYKGQSIETRSGGFQFLGFLVNIHSDDAGNYLSIDRNKLKPNMEYQVRRMIMTSSFRILKKNFGEIFQTDNEKIIGSMYLNYYTKEVDLCLQLIDNEYPQWKAQLLPVENNFTLDQMINEIKSVVIIVRGHNTDPFKHDFGDKYEIEGDKLTISIRDNHPAFYITNYIFTLLDKNYRFGQITEKDGCICYQFCRNPFDDVITLGEQVKVIRKLSMSSNNRNVIPCMAKYSRLKINPLVGIDYVGEVGFGLLNYLSDVPKMLAPYKNIRHSENKYSAVVDLNENMIEWVYKNRKDPLVTKDQIKETYRLFISDFENIIPKE